MDFKIIIIIFFLFLLIQNEMFITNVLSRINNTVDNNNHPTQYGIFVQAIILILCLIVLNVLTENGIL